MIQIALCVTEVEKKTLKRLKDPFPQDRFTAGRTPWYSFFSRLPSSQNTLFIWSGVWVGVEACVLLIICIKFLLPFYYVF